MRACVVRAPGRGGPLKVLVDATNLKPGQGGIRTYTIGLIEALAAEPDIALVVATSVGEVAELGPIELVPVSARTQGVIARALWRERNLASLARSLGVDVVLTPVPELPLRRLPVPSVIVVHDVGPLVVPAFYSLAKRLRYRTFLPRTCRMASAVVCVSQATLTDLQAATGHRPRPMRGDRRRTPAPRRSIGATCGRRAVPPLRGIARAAEERRDARRRVRCRRRHASPRGS